MWNSDAKIVHCYKKTSNFSDLGVWHLHVELGLLCDVDGVGEAGLLEVSHGEVPAAQGPHEGVLGVLVGRELVVDVEVADALHQAVGRVPRHLVAVALLSSTRIMTINSHLLPATLGESRVFGSF